MEIKFPLLQLYNTAAISVRYTLAMEFKVGNKEEKEKEEEEEFT